MIRLFFFALVTWQAVQAKPPRGQPLSGASGGDGGKHESDGNVNSTIEGKLKDNGSGHPIKPEEMAADLANNNLTKLTPKQQARFGFDGVMFDPHIGCEARLSGEWGKAKTYTSTTHGFCRGQQPDTFPTSEWPKGKYGLAMTDCGCPCDWYIGSRYQDNEDNRNNNQWSSPNHFPRYFAGGNPDNFDGRNAKQRFCMKKRSDGKMSAWPKGQYCIFKSPDQKCESMGFDPGYIYWDDEDDDNENSVSGALPDGTYNSNTKIYYCCRDDGKWDNAISLPTDWPFYLFPSPGSRFNCQKVKGMVARLEWYRWDNEDSDNDDKKWGSVPYGTFNRGSWIKLYYCYYWKV